MKLRGRIILLLLLVIMGIMFISPSIQWYFITGDEAKNLALGSLPQIKNYSQTEAQRDWEKINAFVVSAQPTKLGAAYSGFLKTIFESKGQAERGVFKTSLEGYYRDEILSTKSLKDLTLQLGLDLQGGLYISLAADFKALEAQPEGAEEGAASLSQIDREAKIRDVMEYLLSMLDQFGTVEPTIRRQLGSDNIIVELPGAADPERINKIILGKGRLNFHLVNDSIHENWRLYAATHPQYNPESDDFNPTLIDAVTGNVVIPTDFDTGGALILGSYIKDAYGMNDLINYVVVEKTPVLPGEAIANARADTDVQDRAAYVTFTLGDFVDKDNIRQNGADYFSQLTEKNVGKTVAVVLDNKVMSTATVREKIPNGQVRVSGNFTYKDADDLAKVLRSGALPVPLQILNTAEVGASLGDDTIRKGVFGALIGSLLVLSFMILYYKGAGLYANLALAFNVFFLLAILSVTRFTLSLTSIAGIVLTIGMSVDANVLIYERMKEEFRLGKTAKAAVKAGYDRAFWTILDSNATTFIAGIVLALFTKGSIQGFAFTLCAGIVTSFFTALFISRIFFDFTTDVLKLQKLSISWRRLQ